jgi:predicted chitinase
MPKNNRFGDTDLAWLDIRHINSEINRITRQIRAKQNPQNEDKQPKSFAARHGYGTEDMVDSLTQNTPLIGLGLKYLLQRKKKKKAQEGLPEDLDYLEHLYGVKSKVYQERADRRKRLAEEREARRPRRKKKTPGAPGPGGPGTPDEPENIETGMAAPGAFNAPKPNILDAEFEDIVPPSPKQINDKEGHKDEEAKENARNQSLHPELPKELAAPTPRDPNEPIITPPPPIITPPPQEPEKAPLQLGPGKLKRKRDAKGHFAKGYEEDNFVPKQKGVTPGFGGIAESKTSEATPDENKDTKLIETDLGFLKITAIKIKEDLEKFHDDTQSKTDDQLIVEEEKREEEKAEHKELIDTIKLLGSGKGDTDGLGKKGTKKSENDNIIHKVLEGEGIFAGVKALGEKMLKFLPAVGEAAVPITIAVVGSVVAYGAYEGGKEKDKERAKLIEQGRLPAGYTGAYNLQTPSTINDPKKLDHAQAMLGPKTLIIPYTDTEIKAGAEAKTKDKNPAHQKSFSETDYITESGGIQDQPPGTKNTPPTVPVPLPPTATENAISGLWEGAKTALNFPKLIKPKKTMKFSKEQQNTIDTIRTELTQQGMNEKQINAILGNVGKETGFTNKEESFVYNVARAKTVFGVRFKGMSNAQIGDLIKDEKKFAEFLYGGQMGNTQEGDGLRFRGRGYIQITGRDNYTNASKDIFGDDRLVKNPELVDQSDVALKVLTWWMKTRGSQMAKSMGIDLDRGTQDDINLAYTSSVAGHALSRNSKNSFVQEDISKVDTYSGMNLATPPPAEAVMAAKTPSNQGADILKTNSDIADKKASDTDQGTGTTVVAPTNTNIANTSVFTSPTTPHNNDNTFRDTRYKNSVNT